MALDPQEAIQAVRLRRLQKSLENLEAAVQESRDVGAELLRVSRILERGIDPAKIRAHPDDIERLLALASSLEAEAVSAAKSGRNADPRPPETRVRV